MFGKTFSVICISLFIIFRNIFEFSCYYVCLDSLKDESKGLSSSSHVLFKQFIDANGVSPYCVEYIYFIDW